MLVIQNIDTVTRYHVTFPSSSPQSLATSHCSPLLLLYELTNERDRTWRFSIHDSRGVVREGKRIERNETKDGIITPRDICGRAEIEIRDEVFRRCRAQSADTKHGMPRYTRRHRPDETPDRFVRTAKQTSFRRRRTSLSTISCTK